MIAVVINTQVVDFFNNNFIEVVTLFITVSLTISQFKMHKKINAENNKFNVSLKRLHFYSERQLDNIEKYIDALAKFLAYSRNIVESVVDINTPLNHSSKDFVKQYELCIDTYNRTIIYQPESIEEIFNKNQNLFNKVFIQVTKHNVYENPIELERVVDEFHESTNELAESIQKYYESTSS